MNLTKQKLEIRFTYADLADRRAEELKRDANQIRQGNAAITLQTIAIGNCLNEARARLTAGNGRQFWAWVREEFDWPTSVASNWMQVASRFGDWPESRLARIQQSALYVLARNKAPDSAVAEAAERAAAGETITKSIAREILAKHGTVVKERKRMTPEERIERLRDGVLGVLRQIPEEEQARARAVLQSAARKTRPRKPDDSKEASTPVVEVRAMVPENDCSAASQESEQAPAGPVDRPKRKAPTRWPRIRNHDGRAVIHYGGKKYDLGEFGTLESRQKYDAKMREFFGLPANLAAYRAAQASRRRPQANGERRKS